jgi:hypothetical protein
MKIDYTHRSIELTLDVNHYGELEGVWIDGQNIADIIEPNEYESLVEAAYFEWEDAPHYAALERADQMCDEQKLNK